METLRQKIRSKIQAIEDELAKIRQYSEFSEDSYREIEAQLKELKKLSESSVQDSDPTI